MLREQYENAKERALRSRNVGRKALIVTPTVETLNWIYICIYPYTKDNNERRQSLSKGVNTGSNTGVIFLAM